MSGRLGRGWPPGRVPLSGTMGHLMLSQSTADIGARLFARVMVVAKFLAVLVAACVVVVFSGVLPT